MTTDSTSIRDSLMARVLIVGGIFGLVFSFLITTEKLQILDNPDHVPPCSIDPFLSCGSVMKTSQAEVFGFPNSLIGIAGFSVVMAIGFSLLAGAAFRAWFWRYFLGGMMLALVFVFWLFYQSVYVIGKLCPYCMVVWAATFLVFSFVLTYVARGQFVPLGAAEKYLRRPIVMTIGLSTVVALAILVEHWDYWSTLA